MATNTKSAQWASLGANVKGRMEGTVLYLAVDLSDPGQPSKAGKSIVVATTGGNRRVTRQGHKLGLNLFIPNDEQVDSDTLLG